MIFGFGTKGTTNLLTRALDAVNVSIETIADPVSVRYHLPAGLELKVHKDYEKYLQELTAYFLTNARASVNFTTSAGRYLTAWNVMELLSLEEPQYLARVFLQHPLACLGLVQYFLKNAGDKRGGTAKTAITKLLTWSANFCQLSQQRKHQ
jgi:prolycopene isomerase